MKSVAEFVGIGVVFAVVVHVVGVLIAIPVMLLWNALMPDIFGLPTIGFWQALGLSILSSLLFKSSSTSSSSK
jgi:hypothetical protein